MLSSPAVWAIVINNFTFHYAFYVVMNWLPTYFDRVSTARQTPCRSWPGQPLLVPDLLPLHGYTCLQVLHANLAELGGAKTAPYLAMFVTSNFGGWLGDRLIHQHHWSTARARKLVNSLGQLPHLVGQHSHAVGTSSDMQCK